MPPSTSHPWPTLYLDTSVFCYLTARLSSSRLVARQQRLTQVWWRRYRHRHALRISVRVVEEVEASDPGASIARVNALSGIVALPFDERSESLAERFVGAGMFLEKARSVAAHVAITATNSIPLLVTWNCRYAASRTTHRAILRACETEGFRCPDLCTPEQLLRTYAHVRSNS